MPKIVAELTIFQLKKLSEGTHSVGGAPGLKIRITPNNSYFFLRYTAPNGKRRDFTLGQYPLTSLADARDKARDALRLIKQNIDPIESRQAERQTKKASQADNQDSSPCFEKVALMWHKERLEGGFYNNDARAGKTTENILRKHVFPTLGSVSVEKITPNKVLECLKPIWVKTNPTARKARTYISAVLKFAIGKEFRKNGYDSAALHGPLGTLLDPLKNQIPKSKHHAACAVDEIPLLIKVIHENYDSMSARACEFAILTAARSKAVRLATWDEFNLEAGTWQIPMEHDKDKSPDRNRTILLSPQAVALLKALPRDIYSSEKHKLVFLNSQLRAFSDTALLMFLRGLHEKRLEQDGIGWVDAVESKKEGHPKVITLHGTARASFRTWAKDDRFGNNRKFDQEAVELCLLHEKNNKVTDQAGSGLGTAYDRAMLDNERRLIMDEWGTFCYSQINKPNEKVAEKN